MIIPQIWKEREGEGYCRDGERWKGRERGEKRRID